MNDVIRFAWFVLAVVVVCAALVWLHNHGVI